MNKHQITLTFALDATEAPGRAMTVVLEEIHQSLKFVASKNGWQVTVQNINVGSPRRTAVRSEDNFDDE